MAVEEIAMEEPPPGSPDSACTARAQRVARKMRSRHLELLQKLSEKNKEKEDREKRENDRQRKRQALLRDRLLSKKDGLSQRENSFEDSTTASPASTSQSVPSSVQTPTEAAAIADELPEFHEEKQRRQTANKEIEKRQLDMIHKIMDAKKQKEMKKEREQMKKNWRAQKASTKVLGTCKDEGIRQYALNKKTESKPLPLEQAKADSGRKGSHRSSIVDENEKELGKLFRRSSSRSGDRDASAQDGSSVVGEDPLLNQVFALEAGGSSSSTAVPSPEGIAPPEHVQNADAPATSTAAITESAQKAIKGGKAQKSVDQFLARLKIASAPALDRQCTDLSEWKKRNGHAPDDKVFICSGGYFDFRDALLARGWVENNDKTSKFFNLKWGMARDIDHDNLQPDQIVNHFDRCREITTKIGLTLNLRTSQWYSQVHQDFFYPRAFDLYDPLDRADFVLDFKRTKAESVLRGFIEHLDAGTEKTFSEEVIGICLGIIQRKLQDVDDILDDKEMASSKGIVKDDEWAVLRNISLDDVSQRLETATDAKSLELQIQKKTTRQRLAQPAKKKTEDESTKKPKKEKRNKKTKKKKFNPADVAIDGPTASATHLRSEVECILEGIDRTNPQAQVNGSRNAWIIKPAGKSRGRGIEMMRELDEIFKATEMDEHQWICQKYIEKPQLVHGFKFDIRQWVLVTDWNPLTVYVWQQPYIRFAGVKYDPSLTDRTPYQHLVNNSIVKKMEGFEDQCDELDTEGYMWFRQTFENWLHEKYSKDDTEYVPKMPPYTCESYGVRWEDVRFVAKSESDDEDSDTEGAGEGKPADRKPAPTASLKTTSRPVPAESRPHDRGSPEKTQPSARPNSTGEGGNDQVELPPGMWDTCIKPQIKDIILWSLRTVMESVEHRKNSVELFGYDFMFSEEPGKDPKVWLIEVNSSPAMDYSTRITTPLVKKVMEDTAKVLADLRENHDADLGEWEFLQHDAEKQVVNRPMVIGKMELIGTKIEAPKRRFKKKKKKAKAKVPSQEDVPSPEGNTQDDEDGAKEDEDEAEESNEEADENDEENDEDCDDDDIEDGEDEAASGGDDDEDEDEDEANESDDES